VVSFHPECLEGRERECFDSHDGWEYEEARILHQQIKILLFSIKVTKAESSELSNAQLLKLFSMSHEIE
jgi:hypothetical protein